MKSKKSFVMYKDYWDFLKLMSKEQLGVLLTAIFAHVHEYDLPDMDDVTKMAYTMIATNLDRDAEKYAETCAKRSKSGRKGGVKSGESRRRHNEASGSNSKQREANEADTNTDNDNDNDNDSVSVIDAASTVAAELDDTDCSAYGVLNNVLLTNAEYEDIINRYEDPEKLINKVSAWLPVAENPDQPHYPLVLRFAIHDDWPLKMPQTGPGSAEEDKLIKDAWREYQANADRPDRLPDVLHEVGERIGFRVRPADFDEFCEAYRTIRKE